MPLNDADSLTLALAAWSSLLVLIGLAVIVLVQRKERRDRLAHQAQCEVSCAAALAAVSKLSPARG